MPKKYFKNKCTPEEWEKILAKKRDWHQKRMLNADKKASLSTNRRKNYNLSKGRAADFKVRAISPRSKTIEESLAKTKAYRSSPENLAKKRAYGRRPEVRKRQRQRYAEDYNFRLRSILTTALAFHVNKQKTTRRASVVKLLGLEIPEFKKYLESLFGPGMSWNNYGRFPDKRLSWEIDHIRPCVSFDLSNPEQLAQCWHYTNMQPMWASDNRSKNAKWIEKEDVTK